MKPWMKNAAFILAVIAATKLAKQYLPLPGAVTDLLP
jgi:hypothetical protein